MTGHRAVSNHTLFATKYHTNPLCSHRSIISSRKQYEKETAFSDWHRSSDDHLIPFRQLDLPRVDESMLFPGVLWVLGPSSGVDQQGAIRHPGLVAGLAGLGENI